MAVQPANEDGMIRRNSIDPLPGRRPGGRPVLMVPVASSDPASFGLRGRECPDALAKLRFGSRVAQLHAGQIAAAGEKMNVRIIEPGNDKPPMQIDDLR